MHWNAQINHFSSSKLVLATNMTATCCVCEINWIMFFVFAWKFLLTKALKRKMKSDARKNFSLLKWVLLLVIPLQKKELSRIQNHIITNDRLVQILLAI